MKQDGTWGDHVILQATANCYKTFIHVISSQSNHRDLIIRPDVHVSSTNPLVLGHIHEVHYVSLQPKQGEASCNTLCYKTVCWQCTSFQLNKIKLTTSDCVIRQFVGNVFLFNSYKAIKAY